MQLHHIKEIRAFNRFYTNVIGLLDQHILNSRYSLPEVRVMFELWHHPGLTASDIINLLNIDKGYLSRMLRRFEKNKLVSKITSLSDRRIVNLQLTAKGKKEFEVLNQASSAELQSTFKNLPETDCDDLVRKMKDILLILNKINTINEPGNH